MSDEKWKYVLGSDKKYSVSDLGRVWSNISNKEVGLSPDTNGYYSASIIYKGNRKSMGKHRIVALHFIPNPDNLPEVNHKVADKGNNRADNLEWCEHYDNMMHVSENMLYPYSKQCCTIGKEDNIIEIYPTLTNASRALGVNHNSIRASCEGISDFTECYKFRYYDSETQTWLRTKFDDKNYKYSSSKKQLILCHQNGVKYPSQTKAAKELGLKQPEISLHLRGEKADVDGFTFERLDKPMRIIHKTKELR